MVSSKYKVTKEEKVSAENWFSELRDNIVVNFKILKKIFQTILFKLKIGKEMVVVVEK